MKLLFLPGARLSPSARFRVLQFVEPLRKRGHDVTVRTLWPPRTWQPAAPLLRRGAGLARVAATLWLLRDAAAYDAILVHRDLVPEIGVVGLEAGLARRNPRLIFDFDDAIYLGPRADKLRAILPHFAVVTAGNPTLAAWAATCHERVEIWPTVVDTERFVPAPERTPGPLRIGWSGSASTVRQCLPLVIPALQRLAGQLDFELHLIADAPPAGDLCGLKTVFHPWSEESEVRDLQRFDIGLMPLADTPFEQGKCGAKALTYMAIGIPAVVSPVGVNAAIVVDRVSGRHCRSDAEWIATLAELAAAPAERQRLGAAGRQRVVADYSIETWLPRMEALFADVATTGRGG